MGKVAFFEDHCISKYEYPSMNDIWCEVQEPSLSERSCFSDCRINSLEPQCEKYKSCCTVKVVSHIKTNVYKR